MIWASKILDFQKKIVVEIERWRRCDSLFGGNSGAGSALGKLSSVFYMCFFFALSLFSRSETLHESVSVPQSFTVHGIVPDSVAEGRKDSLDRGALFFFPLLSAQGSQCPSRVCLNSALVSSCALGLFMKEIRAEFLCGVGVLRFCSLFFFFALLLFVRKIVAVGSTMCFL